MRNIILFSRLILFIILLTVPVAGLAQATNPFTKVEIETPFHDVLTGDPEFMKQGGARLIAGKDGRMVLIGIGKVFPEGFTAELMPEIRKKGEIRARTAILELGEGVEISTSRESEEKSLYARRRKNRISLSSFFQTSEMYVKGKIRQMPIIGTWWSKNHSTFFVAVGKIANVEGEGNILLKVPGSENALGKMKILEGEEPFLSLLNASPILCQNGGVRGFLLEDNRKILLSVYSASIKSSLIKARKIARLKAVRSLLGQKQGIEVSSVEFLVDQEHLVVSDGKEQRISLSQFLSIQEESLSGVIHALPIVAAWKDPRSHILYVAIGKILSRKS